MTGAGGLGGPLGTFLLILNQANYKKDHEETKSKNYFDVSSTPVYEHQKAHGQATADVSLQIICYNRNHITANIFFRFLTNKTLKRTKVRC